MSLEDNIHALERTPVLAEIGREALRLLAFSAEQINVRGGENIFVQGDPAECAYTIVSGRVRLEALDGPERVVGPGTLIGEMALIVDAKRPCNAFAEGPVRLLVIPRPLFRKMLEEFPHIAAMLRDRLAARMREEYAELARIQEDLDRLPRG